MIPDAGHWLMEERPAATVSTIGAFPVVPFRMRRIGDVGRVRRLATCIRSQRLARLRSASRPTRKFKLRHYPTTASRFWNEGGTASGAGGGTFGSSRRRTGRGTTPAPCRWSLRGAASRGIASGREGSRFLRGLGRLSDRREGARPVGDDHRVEPGAPHAGAGAAATGAVTTCPSAAANCAACRSRS
jgi:hypothetical protein